MRCSQLINNRTNLIINELETRITQGLVIVIRVCVPYVLLVHAYFMLCEVINRIAIETRIMKIDGEEIAQDMSSWD